MSRVVTLQLCLLKLTASKGRCATSVALILCVKHAALYNFSKHDFKTEK